MRKAGLIVSIFVIALDSTNPAWGFGSMIAVGANEAAELEPASKPFSADAVLETAEHTIKSTIYYKPGYARDEMNMGGQEMAVLHDFGADKFFMLMPQGMYMEFESGEKNEQVQEYKLVKREVVGQETVNGFETTKYKVIYEGPDGKYGGFTWFTEDNIAVKAFMISQVDGKKERVNFEITDLRLGEQPDSLFAIPANYRKLDMGGFGLNSIMGGAMNGQAGMGGAMAQEAPAAPTSGSPGETATDSADLQAAQQACLQEKIQAAQEQKKKKRGFGSLMKAASRIAMRTGGYDDLAATTRDIYDANATADDLSRAAKDLGITESDIEACQDPG